MWRRDDPMRLTATRLGLVEFNLLTHDPIISEAIRVSIHYHDHRAPDSIATLVRGHGNACHLQIVYDRIPRPTSLDYTIPPDRYHSLIAAFRRAHFDALGDDENLEFSDIDLWLVERAAGSFCHSVVLSPAIAEGQHHELIKSLQQHLPESIREGA